MTNQPATPRQAAPRKAHGCMTLRLTDLSPEACEALARAPNKSEFVRRALEEYVSRAGDRRELAEIRAALGRIEARLAAGGVPAPAAGQAPPPEADEDAEVLALLAGAFGKLTGGT